MALGAAAPSDEAAAGGRRTRRLAGVLVLALLVGVALWLHATGPGAGAGYDFGAYVAGARAVASGENPYHRLVIQAAERGGGSVGLHANGYVYPPLLAVLLAVPLRLGADARALWLLWNAVNIAAVGWMGWELHRALRGPRPRLESAAGAAVFAVACLLPAIIIYDLSLGQADVLMDALAVGACGLWLRRNPWAGVALGVAVSVKPTLALLALAWLWMGDWRAVARAGATAAALLLAPFLLLGADAARDYLDFLTRWNAFGGNAEYINQSPYGWLLRALTPNPYAVALADAPEAVTPLRWLTLAGGVAAWTWAVPRGHPRGAARGMAAWLLAFPLIVLATPLAEDIHCCLVVPPLVGLGYLAWARRGDGRRAPWPTWPAVALTVAYALACIPRMQELIYPEKFVALPGQGSPLLGPPLVLLRTGALLWLVLVALGAGAALLRSLRAERGAVTDAPDAMAVSPSPVTAPSRARITGIEQMLSVRMALAYSLRCFLVSEDRASRRTAGASTRHSTLSVAVAIKNVVPASDGAASD